MKKILLPILICILVVALGLGIGFLLKDLTSNSPNNSVPELEQEDGWTDNY